MGEVLKEWFKRRLGILIDLTPELFGHYTKDGYILAQILHGYGIINCDQLGTIIQTKDPTLCRVNLKHLRIWLRFIGVDCTDDCIGQISCGKGTTALQLFYKVYLSLEDKDSLYFITLQKEREKYIPSSRKFDVIPIDEEPTPYEIPDHPLSKPLKTATSTIKWYRDKFQKTLKTSKEEEQQVHSKILKTKYPSERIDLMESIHVSMTLNDTKNDDISKEMNDFARKHRIKSSIKDIYYDPCSNDKIYEEIELYEENPDAAKAYVSWLKNRKKKDNIDNTVKSGIQNTLISELRKNLLENQEKCFDELLARRVLDQSHYEKQIITKLSEVLNQKNVMTENRRIVDELMLDAEENKKRLEQDRQREEYDWEYEEIDMEYRRLCELHCKIRQEKLNKLREKHERICREVLYDLIDIALKLSEYRSSNECSLPKAIWNEWKTLFLKCQPIFELFENEFSKEEDDDDEEEEKEEDIEEIVQSRLDREEILNEANFENYHTLQSPWDEYVPSTIDPEIEEILKLGELVLGYIVHRLLEFVYPYPSGPLESPVPKVKTAAIVLGIIEPRLYDSIEILLKNSDIRLVSMKDAINYCLLRYKEEMLDFEYIDANIIHATNDIMKNRKVDHLKNNTTTRSKKIHKSDQISLRRKEKLKEKDKGKGLKEKETQTPRVIPYDDMNPILSDAAHIGKWTYEFLILGQPISNELNTKIIIEYLKSLGEIEGWALIDYPDSYEQMIRLEFALTGHQISQHYVDSINVVEEFDKINIEDIDPVSSRIIYEDTEIDDYSIYRQSKLLPNPIIKKNDSTSTSTFMTTYVRVIPKPINLKVDPNKLVEILSDDVTPIDKFYIEQNIAYVVYYDHFDTNIIKKIVRLVIGDKSMPRTPSIELFGEDALKLLEEHEKRNYNEFSPKKSKIVERSVLSKEKEEEEKKEEKDKIKMKDDKVSDDHLDVHGVSTKPGEDGWKWLDLPINPILLDALATLWENLEEIYIFDLMEIFSLKRIHSMSVIPYKNFLTNNMMKFINRPDTKQNLLHEFQHMFNNVKDDTRNDDDVKCELHCRLIEFQNGLFDICDVKRLECEKERQRIIHENWTSFEAVILINIYLSIIQCEIDRFVDTIQLIQDYYTSMLEKSIKETRYSKILLDKLNIHDIKLQMNENMFDDSTTMINDKYIKDKIDRKDVKKSKNISDKFDFTKPVINVHNLIEEITNLFVNVANSTCNFDTNDCLIYKVINDNVNYVKQFVEFIATRANETMKKEDNVSTGKEKTRRKVDDEKLMRIRIHDLFQEWKYAILFEINRIKMRLDVILGSAKVDVNFLLETMRLTFHQIYEKIIDRYEKEKISINELTKIYAFAIEEEKMLQDELILDGEDFYIKSNILMYPDKKEKPIELIKETIKPFLFTMGQLGRLLNVFKIIAPSGQIPERSLIYVLQDMISYNKDEEDHGFGSMPVPSCWRQLRSCDVNKLIENIFGRNCEYIEWREFLIYAINLPMATQDDILRARDHYRSLDHDLKEIVTIDQYRSVPLWFFQYIFSDDDISLNIKSILFDDFKRPLDGHLFDDEIDLVNPYKLVSTIITDKAIDYFDLMKHSKINENKVTMDDDQDEEIIDEKDIKETFLRLALAKELLCQMYLIDRYSVNYTALLLALCKDEDPREGLGKAFSLAIGSKVCTDFNEGEKYVDKLLEEKRLQVQLESMRNYLREEAIEVTEDIINHLLDKVVVGVIITEENGEFAAQRRLMIQKLDEPGVEIDPSTLLPQITEQISDSLIVSSDEQLDRSTMPEDYEEFDEPIERVTIYWLPYDICLAVLLATLPWHASQSDLFQTTKTLRELLRDTYDELYDDELSEDKNEVLSHRFLNHNFITELLESTSKFTVKRLDNILSEIIMKDKERYH